MWGVGLAIFDTMRAFTCGEGGDERTSERERERAEEIPKVKRNEANKDTRRVVCFVALFSFFFSVGCRCCLGPLRIVVALD